MPIMRHRGVFIKAIQVMLSFGTSILAAHRLKAIESLALLVQTEDFSTHPTQHYDLSNGHDLPQMIEFREKCLAPLMTDFESRKILRPLADVIDRLKRQANRK